MKRLHDIALPFAIALAALAVSARAAQWTYDQTAQTLSDGATTLANVTVVDAAAHTLSVGDNAATVVADGALNLSGAVEDAGGTAWTIAAIGSDAFTANGTLADLTRPASLESIGANAFGFCGSLTNMPALPASLATLGDHAFQSVHRV